MKQSISSQVYNSVLDDIFGNRCKPGQILTERELIEKYGCSKTTVREALVALCREHIVRSIPRCGYEVLLVERSEITDILEFRYVLETGCLSRCIEQITPRHILRLQDLNKRCCDPAFTKDVWTHWDYNTAFHVELIGLAGNRYAVQQLSSAMDTLKRAYAQYYWERRDHAEAVMDTKHHAVLLEALRSRDLSAACSALGKDLEDFAY